jgi:uncharacterized protein YcsI (UPF0317 family)
MNKQVNESEDFGAISKLNKWAEASPKEYRSAVRQEEWTDMSVHACHGYVQANLAIVPKDYAFEFLLFSNRNPRPFPVLDVTEPGDPHPKLVAPEADLRTDLPKYRVFQDGTLIDEPTDISSYWRDNLVAFVIGCSLSFDWALLAANLHYRMFGDYTTNIQCVAAGRFYGPMVVSSRAFRTARDAVRAIQISSRHLGVHGPPVHIGDPAIIGIKDLNEADVWIPPGPWPLTPLQPNETIAFWSTGAGLPVIAKACKVPFMITHCPGHMFVTDKLSEELAVL